MNGVLQLVIGVCFIILCSGLVSWGNKYYSSRRGLNKKAKQEEDRIVQRLEQVEQRLTEVQDVMIALSEKIDRLEERDRAESKSWECREQREQG